MGYVVTLIGFRPAPRTDQVWTTADVQEGPAADGPWTTIDTADPLMPLDTDPMDPLVRSFTTVNATQPDGLWYRIIFKDAAGNEQISAPSFNGRATLAVPTVADIRSESDVVFDEYGYPVPTEVGAADRLEAKRLDAIAELQRLTGVDPTTIAQDSPWVRPVRLAIRLLTEYGVTSNTHDIADTAGDYDLISNYSVGGYSENRRSGSGNTSILHPWPILNRLLTWIADGIGNGFGKDGPDQAFADESQLPPGWRQMERLFGGPGVSPPGPFQPSLADLYRGIVPW